MERAGVIRHPLQWAAIRLDAMSHPAAASLPRPGAIPAVRRIDVYDLRAALADGMADFLAFRSDVVFLCVLYPLAGIALWRFTVGANLLHLAFPLIAGFALVGPLFATGLYEMSRQHEQGMPVTWATAFEAFRSPAIVPILGLGVILLALFAAWLGVAQLLYGLTVGQLQPAAAAAFARDVISTPAGNVMVVAGIGIGAVFAAIALCLSVISFPLLLDRHVSLPDAVRASVQAARTSPREMALWGLMVATLLALGSAPFLIGLVVVLPLLGHATWHLYRRLMPG